MQDKSKDIKILSDFIDWLYSEENIIFEYDPADTEYIIDILRNVKKEIYGCS